MKIFNSILLLVIILTTSCKKEELFNEHLPTGQIKGKLLLSATNKPAKDVVVVMHNTSSGAWHLTYTKEDGTYSLERLASGTYTVVPTNDTLYHANKVSVDIKDGALTQVPDMKLDVVGMPTTSMNLANSVISVTNNSITLKAFVDDNDGHSVITIRTFKYVLNSDARSLKETNVGTTKNINISVDPFTLDAFQTTITGLLPNTEYRVISSITTARGYKPGTNTKLTTVVYADAPIVIKTLP